MRFNVQLPGQSKIPKTSDELLQDLSGILTATTGIDPGYMAWSAQHPLAALQNGGQMQLPVGPWGRLGPGMRTGPAPRTPLQNSRMADAKDMWRQATHSIDRDAPVSGFLDNHIATAEKELMMKRLGLSRDQVQRGFLARKAGKLAFDDQDRAAWAHLHTLFPDPMLVDIMSEQTKGTVRTLMQNAKEQVESRMMTQKANRGKEIKGPAIPDAMESHRGYIQRALNIGGNKVLNLAEERGLGPMGKLRAEHEAARHFAEAKLMPTRMPGYAMNKQFGRFKRKN